MTRYKACARAGIASAPRAMLIGTVAAGALCLVAPRSAHAGPDACVVGPMNVVTCSGNQSGGIDAGFSGDFNPVPGTRLVINNLTQDIGSLSSGDGIRWAISANGLPVDVTSNTGSFSIRASAVGINLNTAGAPVTLNHTGNIFAQQGIRAGASGISGGGQISVSMNGNIVSDTTGIFVSSRTLPVDSDTAPVAVNFTGNITSATRRAIFAESSVFGGNGNGGAVTVSSNGDIVGTIQAESRVSTDGGFPGAGNGISGTVERRARAV